MLSHSFWAQLLQVIGNIHYGPTDFTHHTSTGVWENTLPWPKKAKKLHRHLTDYAAVQTRKTWMDRIVTFYKGQVNGRNNNKVIRMFQRMLHIENNHKNFGGEGLKETWNLGLKFQKREKNGNQIKNFFNGI